MWRNSSGGRRRHGTENTLPVTPAPNSSRRRSDLAGSGTRVDARNVRAATRVTRPVSTAVETFRGLPRLLRLPPRHANFFGVALRCRAGLPGYLFAVVVTVVALYPGARVTPTAAGNARKCWILGAGNQVTSVTRFFAGPREIRRRTSNCRAAFNFPGRSLTHCCPPPCVIYMAQKVVCRSSPAIRLMSGSCPSRS
jgi:hypothetical protein